MLNPISLQTQTIKHQSVNKAEIKNNNQSFTSTNPTKSLQSPSIENLKANFLTFAGTEPELTPEKQARKKEVDAQIREYIMNDEPLTGTHTDVKTNKLLSKN